VSKYARNSVSLSATIHAVKLHGSLYNTHHLLEDREGIVLLHVEEDRQRTFGGLLELDLYVKPERGRSTQRNYWYEPLLLGRRLASEGESEQATVAAYDILLDSYAKLVAFSGQSYTAATPLGCIQFYVWAVLTVCMCRVRGKGKGGGGCPLRNTLKPQRCGF